MSENHCHGPHGLKSLGGDNRFPSARPAVSRMHVYIRSKCTIKMMNIRTKNTKKSTALNKLCIKKI